MSVGTNDVLRLMLQIALPDAVEAQLIFHYLATSGTGGDEDTILTALADNIEAGLEDFDTYISSVVGSFGAVLWNWDFALHQWDGIASEATTGFAGAGAGEVLPNQAAAQLDFFTGVPRRQGRKYVPGLVEACQAGGDLVSGALTAAALMAANFNSNVVSDGITLSPGVFNVDSTSTYYETFEEFGSSVGIETYLSTQRRRKPGVGI